MPAGAFASLMIAALAGLVAVAGFEPIGFAPLTIIAMTALALLWRQAPDPRRAARIGFCFGLGFFGTGVSWVYVSLHDYGMMPAPLAALATALFCAYLALFPAGVGYLQARLRAGPAATLLLAIPALWVLAEWLRGWLFTGFPWLSLGYSQSDTPLAGFAPITGVFGMSLAVALCGGLLALALGKAGIGRTTRATCATGADRTSLIGALIGLTAIVALGGWLRGIAWTSPIGAPITVALAQGNVPQSMKFEEARYASTLETYRRMVEGSAARLVVLPETAIPRFLDQVSPDYLNSLELSLRDRGADLLLGAPLRSRGGVYFNGMVNIGASPSQAYSKSHLVPFGEFVPPGFNWVLQILQIPLSDFNRGRADQQPFALGDDLRVAVNICYEDAFGEEIARQLPVATLLVNASNVAWFGNSLAPAQHLQISRLRAMETGRAMLRATNTGETAIIDERGMITARLPQFTEGLLQGTAQPFTGATPFVRMGDKLALALCLIMSIAAGVESLLRTRVTRIRRERAT